MGLTLADLTPPILMRGLRRRVPMHGGSFTEYPTWEQAVAASSPYETDLDAYAAIADEIRRGARKTGRNLLPIFSALLLGGGKVIDFGGNLGLIYFDVHRHVPERIDWWKVVDLPAVVDYGNEHLADEKLRFFETIGEAAGGERPGVILCAHTLQYVPDPYAAVRDFIAHEPETLVLHELPLSAEERNLVQQLPASLGGKIFPLKLLSEVRLDEATAGYDLVAEMNLPVWAPFEGLKQVARVYRRSR